MEQNNDSLVDKKGEPIHSKNQSEENLEKQSESKLEEESDDKIDEVKANNQANFTESKAEPTDQNMSVGRKFIEFFKFKKGKSRNIKPLIVIALIVIVLAVGGVTAARRYIDYTPTNTNAPIIKTKDKVIEEKKPMTEASKLDGVQVELNNVNKHPLAVMIENHPDARPQSGLEQASLVYEVVAEGGITRFMAIFGPNESDHVGPVRSARTYFIDWAEEYSAFYTHAGGSGNGLAKIKTDKVLDLDYNYNPNKAFWRESKAGLASEHTLYVDTNKLHEIATNYKKWSKDGDFIAWQFKTEVAKTERPETGQVTINFSSPSYKVVYDYDKESNSYKRTLAGLSHKDANSGHQLAPKNIIIQKVNRTEVDSLGKTVGQITDVGIGDAWIFLDGKAIEGSWSKKEAKRRTLFYDAEGAEVKFNPGQTFIEIISGTSTFDYKVGEVSTTTTCTENSTNCVNTQQ